MNINLTTPSSGRANRPLLSLSVRKKVIKLKIKKQKRKIMQAQTEYEKIILEKLKQLPSSYWKEVIDFIEFLKLKIEKNETLFLSEKSLAKEWLLPEEDEAWKDL
ncbi:hypothetical protein [Thermodesulfatator indicus]